MDILIRLAAAAYINNSFNVLINLNIYEYKVCMYILIKVTVNIVCNKAHTLHNKELAEALSTRYKFSAPTYLLHLHLQYANAFENHD